MKGLIGLLIVALIAGYISWAYFTRSHSAGPQSTPLQVISSTEAQSSLLQIAQAERTYFVEHNNYATLDELISSGALLPERAKRPGYSFSVDVSPTAFTATARCQPQPGQTCTSLSVDETMAVHSVQ